MAKSTTRPAKKKATKAAAEPRAASRKKTTRPLAAGAKGSAKPAAKRAGTGTAAKKKGKAPAAKPSRTRGAKTKVPARKAAAPKPPARATAAPAAARAATTPPPAKAPAAAHARTTAPPDRSGKYVYSIIASREPLSFGRIGIGLEPAEVHTVNFKDIAAVVSDTPIEVYDPTRENVLAHEKVNEEVMREHTVIPMSFGTVFKTREDIVELLRSAYEAFNDVLVKMRDKLEFGLKVLWDPEQVVRELEKEDENLGRLKEEISSQEGSTYFARMQYGRLIDSLLQERSESYVREIFAGLRDVSVASRANKPIGDRMIMNAAFLVFRDKEEQFDRKVKQIGSRLDNLTFKYTGPWPPYNFVNIRLKLERAEDEH